MSYSANNNSTQVSVTGYQIVYQNSGYELYKNEFTKMAKLLLNPINLSSVTSTWQTYGSTHPIADNNLKPKQSIITLNNDATVILNLTYEGKLTYKSNGTSLTNKNVYVQMDWSY